MLSGSFLALPRVAAVLLTGCLLSTPALAGGTAYHWVTDDGTYAFTDDAKAIPKRYRSQVEKRTLKPLQTYERFTPVETPRSVAGRAPAVAVPAAAIEPGTAGSGRAPVGPTVSIRTGDDHSPTIDVSPGTSPEPVVIEKQRFRPEGSVATRSNTIVSQGDRVLTIIKPRLRNSNVTEFGDEEDLED
jgi:hypothetical protein